MIVKVLINALGITDSGGIVVLDKALAECTGDKSIKIFIVCNFNDHIRKLKDKYKEFDFILVRSGIIYRVFYENIIFRRLVKKYNIQLVYNFTGSAQLNFFLNTMQLTKIQNLHFYSRTLEAVYHSKKAYYKWLKEIFFKRLYFKFMLGFSKDIEVQSKHVKDCLSDFISIKKKVFYIKSDIDISREAFRPPKKYNFSKKIKFLYIVGPHFELIHKNFIVFVSSMLLFDKMNIDYEINITLTKDQLHASEDWNYSLDSKTNFLGYIDSQGEINKLYCDNTILISTSIVETLGLHVIDAIKNGVITIVPNESYASSVYSENMITYDTLNSDSLLYTIEFVLKNDSLHSDLILTLQDRLKKNEMAKHHNILNIFKKVLNI